MSETEFRNPKPPLKISNVRNNSNREPIKIFDRFDSLSEDESLNETPEANDAYEEIISRDKSGKFDTQAKNKYNSGFRRRKGNQGIGNNKKMFFISSKKLFSFSKYSNFCISVFPSFSPCYPLL